MKAEYANIFIRSAVEVFQKEVNVRLTRHDLAKKDSPMSDLPVCIILGITGAVRGQVVYAMDQGFAYSVARAMLPNRLPAEVKKMVNSAVSEIANIITGQATIALAGESDKLHLTPPAVIRAGNVSVDFLDIPTISLGLISEIGLMEINIALANGNGG